MDTRWERVLPLCRDAIGVFYSSSRLHWLYVYIYPNIIRTKRKIKSFNILCRLILFLTKSLLSYIWIRKFKITLQSDKKKYRKWRFSRKSGDQSNLLTGIRRAGLQIGHLAIVSVGYISPTKTWPKGGGHPRILPICRTKFLSRFLRRPKRGMPTGSNISLDSYMALTFKWLCSIFWHAGMSVKYIRLEFEVIKTQGRKINILIFF